MKNILFCGFGKLGTDCIEKLNNEGYKISYILTHQERKQESVDSFAINHQIEFSYEDTRKNIELFKNIIIENEIDYLISVNYRFIISEEILSIPKYAINIHGSLLPKYRGRTPHVWSIMNGEDYSGITCHLMDKGVDTGDIIEQKKISIELSDTGYTLLQKYQLLYPDILIKSLKKLENNGSLLKQDERLASYYGKRTPDMGYIDFYKPANQIINFIRALSFPYPGAYCYLTTGEKVIINKVEEETKEVEISSIGVPIKYGKEIYVKCLNSTLKLVDYEIKR